MVQINPLVQSNVIVSGLAHRQRPDTNEPISPATNDNNNNQQPASPTRNIPQVSAELVIQSLRSDVNRSDNTRASSNQRPIAQYQINQQLLRREELTSLVGIDLFV